MKDMTGPTAAGGMWLRAGPEGRVPVTSTVDENYTMSGGKRILCSGLKRRDVCQLFSNDAENIRYLERGNEEADGLKGNSS